MNTYGVVETKPNQWAIEWFVNECSQGLLPGVFDTKVGALFNIYQLAKFEFFEGRRNQSVG